MLFRPRFEKWDLVWTIGNEATDWSLDRIHQQAELLIEQAEREWDEKLESS